jgi:hypothetical protein
VKERKKMYFCKNFRFFSRQGMFDDTYVRIPTMGWMFVPLTVYEGGGDAAKFEPMVAHQIEYEWALAQYLGLILNFAFTLF